MSKKIFVRRLVILALGMCCVAQCAQASQSRQCKYKIIRVDLMAPGHGYSVNAVMQRIAYDRDQKMTDLTGENLVPFLVGIVRDWAVFGKNAKSEHFAFLNLVKYLCGQYKKQIGLAVLRDLAFRTAPADTDKSQSHRRKYLNQQRYELHEWLGKEILIREQQLVVQK